MTRFLDVLFYGACGATAIITLALLACIAVIVIERHVSERFGGK
jgi:hypothetical protein